jgi:tetratricopeptide (TPR) repeat protein
MEDIRAFVAHSFVKDDEEVVGRFLKYFDQLSNMFATFSWTHAEAAEPRMLAEKVMSLLNDRNVFIGICTRKERAIEDIALARALFPKGVFKAKEEDFRWKTSDWIIQEIGLARGRQLEIILLIEEGVRDPGGLQGDLEYISFNRSYPERSFGKILEMITAISPRAPSKLSITLDPKLAPEAERKEPEPSKDYFRTPTLEWDRGMYEIALRYMIAIDDREGATAISNAYLNTEDSSKGENAISWKVYNELVNLQFGKANGSLAKLREFAMLHPKNSTIIYYLGLGLLRYQEYRESARTFDAAENVATNELERTRLLRESAWAHLYAGESEAAAATIGRMKSLVETSKVGETELLNALRIFFEIERMDEAYLAVMERMLNIDPSDIHTRFLLAYKYSKIGNNDLALFHYLKIPATERNRETWNNLGVAFDQSELPVKSVNAYRKSEEMGETLAMSNLAEKLIKAGFLTEAQQKCEAALKVENFDENIGLTLAKTKGQPERESNKQKELLEKAKPISDFYIEFGRAVTKIQPGEIASQWRAPECILNASLQDLEFSAIGSYEKTSLGLLGRALMGGFGYTAMKPTPERYKIEYKGKLQGRAIEGHVYRAREGDKPEVGTLATLGLRENEFQVVMYLSDDNSEIRVMEKPRGGAAKLYTLRRADLGGEK